MQLSSINQYFGNVDIYLLDQILKNRFQLGMKVLDAGCGEGRNLIYFLRAGFTVFGIDNNQAAIDALQFIAASTRPDLSRDHFQVANAEQIPHPDHMFDLIISSAVLHFAKDEKHFLTMFNELIRCLKPGGMLFIRMASNIGIEELVVKCGSSRYLLPDGTERFLLTRSLIGNLNKHFPLKYLEPLKTVNVDDRRCMSTLVVSIAP